MPILNALQPTPTAQNQSDKKAIGSYFESIKTRPEALREFFWQMPKGGDIHHHMLGSVMAEDYLQMALVKGLWINPDNYQLYFDQSDALSRHVHHAIPVSELLESVPDAKDEIIDHWSVRNHKEYDREGHHWFFATFEKFEPALIGNEPWFLSKICEAAAKENIQYIETMVAVPSIMYRVADLVKDKTWQPEIPIDEHLEEWHGYLEEKDIDQWAEYNAEVFDHWMRTTDTHGITLRFQTAGLRIFPEPAVVFAQLLLGFKTARLTDNVVGMNFVAQEDHVVSLQNYQTHMAMFNFLKQKHPEVNLSLHAGELILGKGDAQEEDLTYHIDMAIRLGSAQRIGHGVDIHSESNKEQILTRMRQKAIAVEINLESNEVILETDPKNHPLKLYLENGVPACISSDDAAILRSDLTHQYELLVKYHPEISYAELKTLVTNSIQYSFLEACEKQEMLHVLDQEFQVFEDLILQ